ncbi:MAG: class IV adenylate cyclase [Candidatus Omnitrophota bacterium]
MGITVEIKARCHHPARIRAILKAHRARFKGLDRQIDTYFRVPSGHLKLREGNIENALICYKRSNQKNSKKCDATLFPCSPKTPLKEILTQALGVLTVVDKRREIYFIQNTKFHIDRVKKLGSFMEIEVFGPAQAAVKLKRQCEFYRKLLGIRATDLVADSYSDQILRSGKRATGNAERKSLPVHRSPRCAIRRDR